jgi:hypothetical protein
MSNLVTNMFQVIKDISSKKKDKVPRVILQKPKKQTEDKNKYNKLTLILRHFDFN